MIDACQVRYICRGRLIQGGVLQTGFKNCVRSITAVKSPWMSENPLDGGEGNDILSYMA